MRRTLEEIHDGVQGNKCEFAEVSAKYPITVMCRLVGVPREDIGKFGDWLEPQEAAFGQDASMLPAIGHDGLLRAPAWKALFRPYQGDWEVRGEADAAPGEHSFIADSENAASSHASLLLREDH